MGIQQAATDQVNPRKSVVRPGPRKLANRGKLRQPAWERRSDDDDFPEFAKRLGLVETRFKRTMETSSADGARPMKLLAKKGRGVSGDGPGRLVLTRPVKTRRRHHGSFAPPCRH